MKKNKKNFHDEQKKYWDYVLLNTDLEFAYKNLYLILYQVSKSINFSEDERKIYLELFFRELLEYVISLYLNNNGLKRNNKFDTYFTYFILKYTKTKELSKLDLNLTNKRKYFSIKKFNLIEKKIWDKLYKKQSFEEIKKYLFFQINFLKYFFKEHNKNIEWKKENILKLFNESYKNWNKDKRIRKKFNLYQHYFLDYLYNEYKYFNNLLVNKK